VKIILREFHSSSRRRGVEPRQSENERKAVQPLLSLPPRIRPTRAPFAPASLFVFTLRERPERDALKPGCNPGDAIK